MHWTRGILWGLWRGLRGTGREGFEGGPMSKRDVLALGKCWSALQGVRPPPIEVFQPVSSQRTVALAKDRRHLAWRASSLANDLPI